MTEKSAQSSNPSPSWIHPSWRIAVFAYLCTRLPLVVFAWVIDHFRPHQLRQGHFLYHGGEPFGHWLIDAFQKWDSYWFLNIAREGYRFYGVQEQITTVTAGVPETNITPFPLYPLLMKALEWLPGGLPVAGLLIAQLCLLLSLVLLYRLARLDIDGDDAEWIVWAFALVPWTYAFSAIYSESLFFFFTLWAMLCVRRHRYLWAGLLAMLASLSRLLGVLVVIPLAIEYLETRRYRLSDLDWKVLFIGLVPLGTLVYFGYLWWLTGEPFAYFVAQSGWHKQFVGIWHHPWQWMTSGELTPEHVLHIGTVVVMGTLLYLGAGRIRWSYWIYALIYLLVLMSSSYLLGLPRYCAGLFPLYFMIGNLAQRHPYLGRGLLVVFALCVPVVFFAWTSWSYAF